MLPEAAKSRAVIVGASRYRDLAALPTVAANVEEVAKLFTDERFWGLPEKHCVRLVDPEHPGAVLDALARAADEASDALVFYFAGHGILRPDAYDLYLALKHGALERWWHAVRYDDIRRIMMDHPGPTAKVVLLDCCYAGMAMMPGMGAGAEIGDRVRIEGTYLMTAAAETSVALAPPTEPLTAFTGAFVAAVRDGVPDGPDVLDFHTLYPRIRNALEAAGRPAPQQRSSNGGGRIALVRNVGLDDRGNTGTVEQPPLSDHEQRALHLPPARLRELLAELSTRDAPAAERLLRAVGSTRAEQGVAAIVDEATRAGATAQARAILVAAAQRRPASLMELIDVFRKTGQGEQVGQLLTACAEQPADRVTTLAAQLLESDHADAIDLLLDAAVEARMDRPRPLIALLVALLTAGLKGVEAMLARLVTRLPGTRTVEFADALRDAGQEQAAFMLYEGVAELVAARPVAVAARLAATMHRAGRERQARDLVDLMAARHRTRRRRVDLLDALWTAQAPVGDAEHLEHLDDEDLLEATLRLYTLPHQAAVRRLMLMSLEWRPPGSTVGTVVALHDAGLPMEAHSLLEHAAARPPADVVAVVGEFVRTGNEAYARLVLEAGLSVDVLASLPDDFRRLARSILVQRPTAQIVEFAARLPPEKMTWALSALPDDVDPEALRDPAIALCLRRLREPAREDVLRRLRGSLPIPPSLLDAAFSGAFGDAAACVESLVELAEPAAREGLHNALARRTAQDIARVNVTPDLTTAIAATGAATTQLELLKVLETTGRQREADRLTRALRAGLPLPHVCALAAVLGEAALHPRANALLGLASHACVEPADLIVDELLARVTGDRTPTWNAEQIRGRVGLDPQTVIRHVVTGRGLGRGTTVVFTDSKLACRLRSGHVVAIAYRHFGGVTIVLDHRSTIRLRAGGREQSIEIRDAALHALLVRVQQAVAEFDALRARLRAALIPGRNMAAGTRAGP
ncbi:caspase family protein [Actinoplanes sp. NPDC051346]|uniref:caspase, EACC1-associated type n=1 Tax=Actinoplanes sp. NPDC051346 TaxID=3155048 RepID=UPI00342B2561